jgi:hypothetical protein
MFASGQKLISPVADTRGVNRISKRSILGSTPGCIINPPLFRFPNQSFACAWKSMLMLPLHLLTSPPLFPFWPRETFMER